MTQHVLPSIRVAADEVFALLAAHPTLHAYRGDEIDRVALPADASGAVYAYAVFWPGVDDPADLRLSGVLGRLVWRWQVTCAGGTQERAAWAADQVRGLLLGVRLSGGGLVRRVPGAPPVMKDPDVSPPRWFAALPWEVTL